jgi:hypothetical protein
MITGKLNVMLIDKAKLYKGEKGTYLDFVLIETPGNQYGNDYMIVQSVTKEEREKGIKGVVLGNCKVIGQTTAQVAPKDDLPF